MGSRHAAPLSLAETLPRPSSASPSPFGGAARSTRRAPGFRGRASLSRAAGICALVGRTRPLADVSRGPAREFDCPFYFTLVCSPPRGAAFIAAAPAQRPRPHRPCDPVDDEVRRRPHPSPPRSSFPPRVLRAAFTPGLLPRPTCSERRLPRGLCQRWRADFLQRRHPFFPRPTAAIHISSPPSVGGEPHRGNSWGGRGDRPGRPEHGSGLWSAPLPRPAAGGRSSTQEPAEVKGL